MFRRKSFLGVVGAAAIVAGLFLFISGREFSGHWIPWVVGPLLWFLGGSLVIGWLVALALASSEARRGNSPADESTAVKRAG